MSIAEQKRALRKQILNKRDSIPAEDRAVKSVQAARNLLALESLARCRTIMLFLSFGSEIDTVPFIEAARARGQTIWLPVTNVQEKRLIPYVYSEGQVLRQGAYGIKEPDPDFAKQGERCDLEAVILPGVAFDQQGGRLGYGGGFYDRFLSSLDHRPLLVGYCFNEQIVECVPKESHDITYDCLVKN
ncbi:5-formyltetrahydrofolate cyclo-ligase [Brevibacillus ginsengisoli]|uniref:5-formyltetrahydrofolate cyclo-ligase n=1 Tax=Brevibacillus ginsengisoli TaxID=363854 RepID=UPI003CF85BF8